MATTHNTLILVFTAAITAATGCITTRTDTRSALVSFATVSGNGQVQSVRSALVTPATGNVPASATLTSLDIDVASTDGLRLGAMASSREILALGYLDINDPVDESDGRLEVYRMNRLLHRFDDADLERKIVDAAPNFDAYPDAVFAFHPISIGFESSTTLVARIQPQGALEAVPADVILKINARSGDVIGEPEFVDRSLEQSPPALPENRSLALTSINGRLLLNGAEITGMPTNIHGTLFTQSAAAIP